MNKQDLVGAISNQTDLPKTVVEKVVNSFMATVVQSVVAGEHVQLIGFGSFNTLHRKARNGRNPATGKAIKIPAKVVPRFVPGKAFKDAVVPPKPKKSRAKK